MENDDYGKQNTEPFKYVILAIAFFSIGVLFSNTILGNGGITGQATTSAKPEIVTDEKTCETFCSDVRNNMEYGYVDDQGNCFCLQQQATVDMQQQQNIQWKQMVKIGVIKDVSTQPLTQQQIQRIQQLQQQQMAQQQTAPQGGQGTTSG